MRLYMLMAIVFSLSFFTVDAQNKKVDDKEALVQLMHDYDEATLKLDPVSATSRGDNRFNHLLFIDFTDSFQTAALNIYSPYQKAMDKINRNKLDEQGKINYDVMKMDLELRMETLLLKTNLFPFSQRAGLPLSLPVYGSGSGLHPFNTVKDYDDWLSRAAIFPAWADSAIVYFRKGMREDFVLSRSLVEKMIPQMAAIIKNDPTQSAFYTPVNKMPADFPEHEKQRITSAFTRLITTQLHPAYQRLHDFLKQEYILKARSTSGYGDLPGGDKIYKFLVRAYTTTNITADEVYNIGIEEVKRIQGEMEKVKQQIGYKGTLNDLFNYMKTDPQFFPYKTEEEILNAYRSMQQKIEPALKTMFNNFPKTTFEVRQVEAFRAASTPPQYADGSLENNRPGIFYVPIVNVANTSVDESIFLHEAIPGHHYQKSLQRENKNLPNIRRYGGYAAFGEGWGLYTESLGKALGLYTDPYQYMRALGWEIHRAIRLVVDAGLHTKSWSREQAIKYMLENEPITEQFAVSEIERYMSRPGQAVSYKIGELKIKEMRERYMKQLGVDFNLAAFHDAMLIDGALPLEVMERKMDTWAKQQQKKKKESK